MEIVLTRRPPKRAVKRDADTKHYNNKWAAPGGVLHYYYYYYIIHKSECTSADVMTSQ